MAKIFNFFFICFLFVPISISAQGSFLDAYNEFKKQALTDYADYRRKANLEYAEWMRKAWVWYQKIEPMSSPKDEMLPPLIYNNERENIKPRPIPHKEITPIPEPNPQPKPVAPIREDSGEYKTVDFRFYGTNGTVRLPNDFAFKLNGFDEMSFAMAWEELSTEKYDNLIRDCLILRMEHQLCDWAYLMMLGIMSETICGKGTNEAVMLQAFVFCQSGYKIRLGLTVGKELRLLFKSEHLIFDLGGIKMDDGFFYLLQPINDEGLSVCDISYPEEKPLSLWIKQEQKFNVQMSKEQLFVPADSMIAIRSKINENLIDFYKTYPTSVVGDDIVSRWAIYANTPLSQSTKSELYPQLKAIIAQADNALVAVSWLLYWVQTAFVYEYDEKVWGRDRAFFAEETLYYPFCDCEDRSILFSRLVRDLLGLDVILVFYPGHLATAVAFNTPIEGDYIETGGKRYTICDPTYIGAPIGVTMPEMDNHTAKIIVLK